MFKLSIRAKLMGAFAFVTVLEIALSVVALGQLSAIDRQVQVMRSARIPAVESVLKIEQQIGTYRRREFIDLLSPAVDLKAAEADIADTSAAIDQALIDYQPLVADATDSANLASMTRVWNTYRNLSAPAIQLARDGKADEGYQLLNFGPVNDAWDAVGAASTTWEAAILAQSDATSAAAAGTYSSGVMVVIGLLVFAVAVGFAVGFFISYRIRRDVHAVRGTLTALADETASDLADAMAALASNNLTAGVRPSVEPIARFGSDEVGDLAAATNVLVSRLGETIQSYEAARVQMSATIGEVRGAAAAVAATSSELNQAAAESGGATQTISRTIQQVAAGAADQARAASDTGASAHELTAVIEQVRASASETSRRVEQAAAAVEATAQAVGRAERASEEMDPYTARVSDAVSHGARSVNDAAAGMGRIQAAVQATAVKVTELGAKSDQIGAIVETIDDIAEQTNLLALNAAIEAARAGEQGKGFAVVADEVRKLAERSSRATKEIAALIGQVQAGTEEAVEAMQTGAAEVTAGSRLAEESAAALREISDAAAARDVVLGGVFDALKDIRDASSQVVTASDAIAAIASETNQAAARMTSSASTVAHSVESIAAVSEENSAASDEVSAATQEMSAQVHQVMSSAERLAQMAGSLDALVARFRTDAEGAASAETQPSAIPMGYANEGFRKRRAA
jgi:methyl-accepting chemotaxis protein